MHKVSAEMGFNMEKVWRDRLIETAIAALSHAYAPYSNFFVGSALLTENNKIYTGCNIENAAYSPSNCAERTAFFKAISEGERSFKAISIVGGTNKILQQFCSPCGVCRQVMAEFCSMDQFEIILATSIEEYKEFALGELLPESFLL